MPRNVTMQCLLCFSGESLHLDSQQPEDSGTCFLGVGAHFEDHPSKRGLTNHGD